MSNSRIRATIGAALVILTGASVVATRPATSVAGVATADAAASAELGFPYPAFDRNRS